MYKSEESNPVPIKGPKLTHPDAARNSLPAATGAAPVPATGARFNRNRLNPRINYHHKSTAYDDTVADPLELNAEPGIEDLSRQILSEVQLHQANIELRKEQEAMDDPELMQGVRNMPNNCAVPPCYIA
ncbi:arthropod cardioacceleratory peptide 2a [Holotrichia oblita]|uniref:Arthropod cardioacceleratory peptide 2a n=1 Tax=Holotrichia oblita TaxID=644536 RepID=A0ACB9TPS8_HOLOL|nr:arthropod cardioacceleratory peptide 2a [Holotrichia oblita]